MSVNLLKGIYPFSGEELKELALLQEVSVTMYFSDSLVKRLDSLKLNNCSASLLPDINDLSFKVECHGRRIMIARELGRRFKKTFSILAPEDSKPEKIIEALFFKEFISSKYFLTPNISTPHPYGIGCGYENVSKFFFWMRDYYELSANTQKKELRSNLYLEFALHLLSQVRHSSEKWFQNFKSGIFFKESVNENSLIAVDQTLKPQRIHKDISALLLEKGFVDLDSLTTNNKKGEISWKTICH